MNKFTRRFIISVLAFLGVTTVAVAHHGWSWTDSGDFQLTGVIREVYFGNPHVTLDLDVEGVTWRVELGPPAKTESSGFAEGVAKVGDEVVALGQRSTDPKETRMKAERITVGGKSYDIYPERLSGS